MSAGAQPAVQLHRRTLLKAALGVAGALVIGVDLSIPMSRAAAAETAGPVQMTLYVRIAPDETVTVLFPLAEMGSGIMSALPQILAEELKVDWSKVRVQTADADVRVGFQLVGGSNAVRSWHGPLRKAGAQAREVLVQAAANRSGRSVTELVARAGAVYTTAGSLVATYGALVADAALLTPPATPTILGSRDVVGTAVPRVDIPAKTNGSAVFGIDVRPEGLGALRYASVQQAPKIGQTLTSWSKPTVGTAVRVTGGVAVVVESTTWQAIEACRALRTVWADAAYTASLTTSTMKTEARRLLDAGPVRPALSTGDPDGGLRNAASRISGTYSVPYVAHATMEPMNATAYVKADAGGKPVSCTVWAPTQSQTWARAAAAKAAGLDPVAVTVHTTFLGGGLGRRLEQDYITQAVEVARALPGRPVKLVWSREEDFTHDVYRPSALCRLDAGVDSTGLPTTLTARIVSPSIVYQRLTDDTKRAAYDTDRTVDNNAVEGFARKPSGLPFAADMPYAIPNLKVEWVRDTARVPVGYWRSVGHSHNTFFLESLLDEVAATTGQDPIALRKRLLAGKTRHLAVLDRVAALSGWAAPAPAGRARGVALTEAFGSIVAQVAEVSGTSSNPTVHKVTVVIDCGSTINPDTVKAQMEGAVVHGLTTALYSEMPFNSGKPTKDNFNSYRMLRLKESPAITVDILESGASLGGVGEPGVPPLAPAVANALATLTGRRVRSLPLTTTTV